MSFDSAVIDSRYRSRAAARFATWEGSSSGMTQTSAAKRRHCGKTGAAAEPIVIILFILSKNSARRGMTHDSIERNRKQHSEDGGHQVDPEVLEMTGDDGWGE